MAISKELQQGINVVANNLGVPGSWLTAVIGFETGWTFSPKAKNPITGATGLIQFMPKTALSLGTSVSDLATMTEQKQLLYVEQYLQNMIRIYGKPKTLSDLYMLVFYPAATTKPITYQFSDSVYQANKVFDTSKKGYITKEDVQNTITAAAKKKGINITTLAISGGAILLILLFSLYILK